MKRERSYAESNYDERSSRHGSVPRAIPVALRNGYGGGGQAKAAEKSVTEEQTRTEEVERTVRHHKKKSGKQRSSSGRREWSYGGQPAVAYYQVRPTRASV